MLANKQRLLGAAGTGPCSGSRQGVAGLLRWRFSRRAQRQPHPCQAASQELVQEEGAPSSSSHSVSTTFEVQLQVVSAGKSDCIWQAAVMDLPGPAMRDGGHPRAHAGRSTARGRACCHAHLQARSAGACARAHAHAVLSACQTGD